VRKRASGASVWLREADYGVSSRFLSLVRAEPLRKLHLVDVGCGWGRVALLLAREAKHVVGLDNDRAAIRTARRLATERSLGNVKFVVANAERVEYGQWRPGMVIAHLCMSDAIIERASRALAPGCCLAFVCFHTDQWKETGKVSRFAYSEERLRSVLEANGFIPEALEVDTEVVRAKIGCLKDLRMPETVKVMPKGGDMAEGLATISGAIGMTTMTVVEQSGARIKPVSLNGVAPSPENVRKGAYSLTRDSFLVSQAKPSETVAKFLAFVRSPAGAQVISANGAIPVN